jgi:23S rRNA (guanine2445-N2)-methyltransferase / 23S rRNA (guanine2069-N7)-methyltransferase
VFFSNNYRRFKLDEELVQRLGFSCREITKQTIPPEYRNDRIHRCWRMQLGSNQR